MLITNTLADVIDKVKDAYELLELAIVAPYEPQGELFAQFDKLTQLTNCTQLWATKAIFNLTSSDC